MADGPSAAEDTSSSSSSSQSAELSASAEGARVPRERHKASRSSLEASLMTMSSCVGGKRHSSSEDVARRGAGSGDRRGTRQHSAELLGKSELEDQLSSSASLKIASAVVLVERSEIAIGKKLGKLSSALLVASAAKKDSKKDKVGEIGAVKSEQIVSPDLDILQDNQQQQQQHRKSTRAAIAAEKKAGAKARAAAAAAAAAAAPADEGADSTLDGPCAKKRCVDRYDSSESSDSGVAISCGDCSSSSSLSLSSASSSTSGSDITEPGSPCGSTSSDEGVQLQQQPPRGSSDVAEAPALAVEPSGPKLAPSQQQPAAARPQWPWTPPLGVTACSNGYKRFKAEPEHGSLPRQAADPGLRHGKTGATKLQQQQQDSQGKITEYFKSQIKPQQSKTKKNQQNDMSVLAAKNSGEFRRPATVQRNGKNGLAKYHVSNGSRTSAADWEVRALSQGLNGLQPRLNGKHNGSLSLDQKSTTTKDSSNSTTTTNGMKTSGLPVLPIPSDVLSTLPSCKISNLRLASEASPSESPPPILATPTALVNDQTNQFKDNVHLLKPNYVNENNNLTSNNSDKSSDSLLSRLSLPPTPSDSNKDEDEESSRDSAVSKQSSSPSPILSAPTTIRFPAKAPSKNRSGQSADSGFCRWQKCEVNFDTSGALLEHLQAAHINTQTGGDNFVCHWQGCKVEGRSSCSRRWLERHVLSHGGNKPFQCIVDGCGSRFSSQTALERHVNGHFNQSETSSTTSRKSTDSSGKLVRRNGKKLRYRRQPWSARIFDYFDPGVMESLQHRLLELAQTRTQGRLAETPGDSMALTSQVIAKRVEMDGKTRVLLRWHPQDIEPDEWVLESEIRTTKHVAIRKIAARNPDEVNFALYPAMNSSKPMLQRVKQRRKPVKTT